MMVEVKVKPEMKELEKPMVGERVSVDLTGGDSKVEYLGCHRALSDTTLALYA